MLKEALGGGKGKKDSGLMGHSGQAGQGGKMSDKQLLKEALKVAKTKGKTSVAGNRNRRCLMINLKCS